MNVILSVGITGSGKYKKATNFINTNEGWLLISIFDIRKSVYNMNYGDEHFTYKKWNESLESYTETMKESIIKAAINNDQIQGIYLVDTHLNKTYLQKTINLLQSYGVPPNNIKIEYNDARFIDAVQRDAMRLVSVGAFMIAKEKLSYNKLQVDKLIYLDKKPECVIISLDGCLSESKYYDVKDALDYKCNKFLKSLIQNQENLMVVSTRLGNEVNILLTQEWLKKNTISHQKLYLKDSYCKLSDFKYKESVLVNNIYPYYNVLGAIDNDLESAFMYQSYGVEVLTINNQWKF